MRADLALIGFILTLAGGITLLVLRQAPRRRAAAAGRDRSARLAAAAFALYLAATLLLVLAVR